VTDKQRSKLNGILGTIAFHLLFVVFFMGIKLHKADVPEKNIIEIDFEETDDLLQKKLEQLKQDKQEALASELEEEVLKSNRAVNLNEKTAKELSTEEYVKDLMKELNIETLESPKEPDVNGNMPSPSKPVNQNQEPPDEGEYAGPTKIKYALKDRSKVYIPVPSFKCPDRGLVVVDIVVNPSGDVLSANISPDSPIVSGCLASEALQAARQSQFNRKADAPEKQQGYISFEFRAQRKY